MLVNALLIAQSLSGEARAFVSLIKGLWDAVRAMLPSTERSLADTKEPKS